MTQASTLGVGAADRNRHAISTLIAALLGFFTITLDAVVVNVTLPTIRHDLGRGVAGLQWVVDGYTLMFAAMMPASMALIRQAYPEPRARARAVGIWAMGGLTYGAIEAGSRGFTDPAVVVAFVVAAVSLSAFIRSQHVVAHPMLPLELFRSRTVTVVTATGFAFMVGYFGLPFVVSLFLQQQRGLDALHSGAVFLPMMLVGLVLTPFSARISERFGRRTVIATGLALMTAGLAAVGLLPATAPLWLLSAQMVLVGLGGPTVSPPATAVLLDTVAHHQAGVASGVFNTSRQVGGALAIAVFGGLLTNPDTFVRGVHASLLIAAAVTALTTGFTRSLPRTTQHHEEH